ncbi:MAG TPA: DUF262 domain-containing protein [Pyrinomonadaceae bacterium]|nr:DUF262 domain-containing protein [Pyrinomonadaceae bacterium]
MNPPILETYRLVSIFRKIENGEIRVPAFQRSFVWTEQDILKLIESVYSGYPIGTIVFLRATSKMFESASPRITGFPEVPEQFPVNFIIDGVQRLSSLYNCFHWKSPEQPDKFNIVFNLDTEQFVHYSKDTLPENYIHLSSVFSPDAFFELQSKFLNKKGFDRLVSAATNLHFKFETYEVTTMIINEDDINQIISIFESLNNTGVRLTGEDLTRAEALRTS